MTINVYHYRSLSKEEIKRLNGPDGGWDSEPRFREYADITGGFAKPETMLGAFFSDYDLVAVVDSDDLEEAWALTNHIDHDWTDNEKVWALTKAVRSSSVGDIFVVKGGGFYAVAGVGFKKLN